MYLLSWDILWHLKIFKLLLTYFYFSLVEHIDAKRAGDLSTLFDVGGIFGECATMTCLLFLKPTHTYMSLWIFKSNSEALETRNTLKQGVDADN